jgi:hypothetical protein
VGVILFWMCLHQLRRKVMIQRRFYEELEQVVNHNPKYHMKILLDLNVKSGREDIFKPTIGMVTKMV